MFFCCLFFFLSLSLLLLSLLSCCCDLQHHSMSLYCITWEQYLWPLPHHHSESHWAFCICLNCVLQHFSLLLLAQSHASTLHTNIVRQLLSHRTTSISIDFPDWLLTAYYFMHFIQRTLNDKRSVCEILISGWYLQDLHRVSFVASARFAINCRSVCLYTHKYTNSFRKYVVDVYGCVPSIRKKTNYMLIFHLFVSLSSCISLCLSLSHSWWRPIVVASLSPLLERALSEIRHTEWFSTMTTTLITMSIHLHWWKHIMHRHAYNGRSTHACWYMLCCVVVWLPRLHATPCAQPYVLTDLDDATMRWIGSANEANNGVGLYFIWLWLVYVYRFVHYVRIW